MQILRFCDLCCEAIGDISFTFFDVLPNWQAQNGGGVPAQILFNFVQRYVIVCDGHLEHNEISSDKCL